MLKNKFHILILVFMAIFSFSFAQDEFIYSAGGKRNPFIPLVSKDGRLIKLEKEENKTKAVLSIEGIIYDKQGISYALVNSKVSAVGDYVDGYRVLKIEADRVIFLKDDQMKEVLINKEDNN